MFLVILLAGGCMALAAYIILNQGKLGKHPEGKRLERIQVSPNYRDGEFHNTVFTPTLIDDESLLKIMRKTPPVC